jgi:hypothetical protein
VLLGSLLPIGAVNAEEVTINVAIIFTDSALTAMEGLTGAQDIKTYDDWIEQNMQRVEDVLIKQHPFCNFRDPLAG